jgi:RNA polymerase sigma factor (sigma-70 family)
MPDKREELIAFYRQERASLERAVARQVRAPQTLIEDACSFAWCELVARLDGMRLGPGAFWWLHKVAVREAWRLAQKARRQVAAGDVTELDHLPGCSTSPLEDLVDDREALRMLDDIPERRRRLLLLHALGFTYAEIGRMTGDTPRTVERLLRKTRQELRGRAGGGFTERELQVLDGLANGSSASRIASDLALNEFTVRDYIARVYRKLGVSTCQDAVIEAERRRLSLL